MPTGGGASPIFTPPIAPVTLQAPLTQPIEYRPYTGDPHWTPGTGTAFSVPPNWNVTQGAKSNALRTPIEKPHSAASLKNEAAGDTPSAEQQLTGVAAGIGQIFDGARNLGSTVVEDVGNIGWNAMPSIPRDAPRSIADASLQIATNGRRYSPSPDTWNGQVIYSLIWDRFGREAPFQTWGDPASPITRHGGNIRGATQRLDYLKNLGVTALLVNPLYLSPPAAYHNYWPVHFMAVDPNLGTMDEFRQFVREAHKRGMRVILDVVFNHTAPVIEYEDGWKFGPTPKIIKRWVQQVFPIELNDPKHYHFRGSIDDWHDPEQVRYGDFPGGLNHLATERPETQDVLLTIAKWWLKETDVDGFRLDTYLHIAPAFFTRLYREVMQFAEYLGKKKFLILGEIYHGDPHVIAPELAEHRVNAAFNYPAYFWDLPALLGNAPTRALEESFQFVSSGIGQGINRMVRFFENHDKPRFTGQPELLAVAHTYNMLSVGIPFIYYGSEQGFSRAQSNVNLGLDAYREDMFPGGEFRSAGSTGDDFNQKSPIYRHISALARARKSYPALSKGEQFIRWSDPNGPGIFAFSRIYENEEVVVVINTSNQPKTETWWVDASLNAHGEIYKDLLDREYKTAIHSPTDGRGSQMTVTIPPYGSRVLVVQKRP